MSKGLKAYTVAYHDEGLGKLVVFHYSRDEAHEKFQHLVDGCESYDVERLEDFDKYIAGGEPREFPIEGNERIFYDENWWYQEDIRCGPCGRGQYDAIPESVIKCQDCCICAECIADDGEDCNCD